METCRAVEAKGRSPTSAIAPPGSITENHFPGAALSSCYGRREKVHRATLSVAVRRCVLAVLCGVGITVVVAQQDALHEASAALERGDYAAAEIVLRWRLRTAPADPVALSLLGVALDSQKKYAEAGLYDRRALALAPRSASLLNNYGNHLLAIGQTATARTTFLKVLAVNPAHPNANTQLARLALDRKDGPQALHYLDRLPAEERQLSEIALLRLRALYLSGRNAEAESILEHLAPAARGDARLSFSAGLALAAAGQYAKAEEWFSQTLEMTPANFDVLYNLGLAASHSGHQDRAYNVLQTALQLRPDDVDVLYNLGAIDFSLNRNESALTWLARAAKLGPDRSDIQYLLAQTASELGYYPDSALAWERYVKLVPKDDTARRERGFTTMLAGHRAEGLADLQWYLVRHPGDATAHYEIAIAHASSGPDAARQHLNTAIALRPDFTAAYYARGVLLFGENQPESALADFLSAARRSPGNSAILDQLGRTYLALDRGAEAVAVLRKAVELNPNELRTLMHLGRALAETGQTEEARQVLARFRTLKTLDSTRGMPAAGFVELLALPPEQQHARYRARVEKALQTDPNDVTAKLRYLMLLLGDEAWPKAEAVVREIVALKPGSALLAEAGRALLNSGRYAVAAEVLRQCQQAPGASLDLAIAVFHDGGAEAGLHVIDGIPAAQRDGDYHLARAEMLDTAGRFEEAAAAVEQALRAAPTRADLLCQAALFLIKNGRNSSALQLLDQATRIVPDNPSILLTQAITLEVSSRDSQAEQLLQRIEKRWPEWPGAQLVYGIVLEHNRNSPEALNKLTAAIALGAREPAAYYYLAEATLQARPDEVESAEKAIREALALDPNDPWAHTLAGRIYFDRNEYEKALGELHEAVRLQPRMVQAHYNLARVYQELGRGEEAHQEVEQVRMLRERFPNEPDDPDLLHSDLFAVAPPEP